MSSNISNQPKGNTPPRTPPDPKIVAQMQPWQQADGVDPTARAAEAPPQINVQEAVVQENEQRFLVVMMKRTVSDFAINKVPLSDVSRFSALIENNVYRLPFEYGMRVVESGAAVAVPQPR